MLSHMQYMSTALDPIVIDSLLATATITASPKYV